MPRRLYTAWRVKRLMFFTLPDAGPYEAPEEVSKKKKKMLSSRTLEL